MNQLLMAIAARRAWRRGWPHYVPPEEEPPEQPEEPDLILGVGSASTSLTDYPKSGNFTTGDYYVDPSASTNGVGSLADPFDNLSSAFSAVSDGERIIVRAGTIYLSSGISRSTSWSTGIEVFAYGTERPVIVGQPSGSLLTLSGDREHWKGFEFRDAAFFTVYITGDHNTIEDCWGHDGKSNGFYILGSSPTGNVIQDCRGWNMARSGADGIDVFKCAGPDTSNMNTGGNAFVRCFAKWGQDDNYDLFNSYNNKIVDCVSTRAGLWWDGSEQDSGGNGTGFKLGNSGNPGGNILTGSVAYANKLHGISENFTSGAGVTITRCTSAFNTWVGYQAEEADNTLVNNIAYGNGGPSDGKTNGTIDGSYNTWNLSITNPQFADANGYDFSLASGSACIDAAHDGGNIGASTLALNIAKEWLAKDLT